MAVAEVIDKLDGGEAAETTGSRRASPWCLGMSEMVLSAAAMISGSLASGKSFMPEAEYQTSTTSILPNFSYAWLSLGESIFYLELSIHALFRLISP